MVMNIVFSLINTLTQAALTIGAQTVSTLSHIPQSQTNPSFEGVSRLHAARARFDGLIARGVTRLAEPVIVRLLRYAPDLVVTQDPPLAPSRVTTGNVHGFMHDRVNVGLDYLLDVFGRVLATKARGQVRDGLFTPDFFSRDFHFTDLSDREIQVFSIAFLLLNTVEEIAAEQARRHLEAAEDPSHQIHGLWPERLALLRSLGFSEAEILKVFRQTKVEIVLTGHPTEARRQDVIRLLRELYKLMVELEIREFSPTEVRHRDQEILAVLARLWGTEEAYFTKGNLDAERENVLYYLRGRFPGILEILDERLQGAWMLAGFSPEALLDPQSLPRFSVGNWVGGDRDGHPGVTANFTKDTLTLLRSEALDLHQKNLEGLKEDLTLSTRDSLVSEDPIFESDLDRMKSIFGDGVKQFLVPSWRENPWRQYVSLMIERLPQADKIDQTYTYRRASELLEDLERLRLSLERIGYRDIAQNGVFAAERAVIAFGFHMARLDLRQDSFYHDKAITQILIAARIGDAENYSSWDKQRKLAFLREQLSHPEALLGGEEIRPPSDSEARGVLDDLRTIADHIERFGPEGLGPLIVSMTRDETDLLAMFFLAKEAHLLIEGPEGLVSPLEIVPLFETIESLRDSPRIMGIYFQEGIVRRSLGYQFGTATPRQQIMLGYSDSAKDGGIFASQWALRNAQTELADAGRRARISIEFFHGRGGTVSRGAGPTHHFLSSLPSGTLEGGLRVTAQGETVTEQFSNPWTGAYNAELWLAGTLVGTMLDGKEDLDPRAATYASDLARWSFEKYRKLLEEPRFQTFYSQATPEVRDLAIFGSRPGRRSAQDPSLQNVRAISWVFGWTQARFYLPGWFGVGSALQQLYISNRGGFTEFVKISREDPFLYYVLTNIESNLVSTNLEIMREYASLVEDEGLKTRIMTLIEEELELTKRMVALVMGGDFVQRRPRLQYTVRRRAKILTLLHRHQIQLLRQWRIAQATDPGGERTEQLRRSLILSVNAISHGLRTTG